MTVKELIAELLECRMDTNFDIDIKTDQEEANTSEFRFYTDRSYTTLKIEIKDQVLIDKDEYYELLARITELENQ